MGQWLLLVWTLASQGAIYERDDRKGIGEFTDSRLLKRVAAVALVPKLSSLRELHGGAYALRQETFSQYQASIGEPLCAEERFRSETIVQGSVGSGFLVAPDVLVTAGHVIEDQGECEQRAVVFGYWNPHHRGLLTREHVYRCKTVLHSENEGFRDFAILRLDRPVTGVSPLAFRTTGRLDASSVWMAGFPLGLTLKITENGSVIDNTLDEIFLSLLDTYPGNSGGPVFNDDGLVEGILIEGEITDITLRGEYPGGCWYSKVYCDAHSPADIACDSHRITGAKVVRSSVWAEYVP